MKTELLGEWNYPLPIHSFLMSEPISRPKLIRRVSSVEQSSGLFRHFKIIAREEHLEQNRYNNEKQKELREELQLLQQEEDREKAQRKRELARERQRRHRNRQKQVISLPMHVITTRLTVYISTGNFHSN
jgi:hypothetical protein